MSDVQADIIDPVEDIGIVAESVIVDDEAIGEGVVGAETEGGDEARPTRTKLGKAEILDREGDAAADYLEGLLDIADLDGDIDIDVEGNRAMVSVVEASPGDLQHLVGADGKVLEALQELTRLAATRETGERSRLMLDIAGYRAARRAELVTIAEAAVAEAQRTSAPVRMDPMSPFERKVVHDVVADSGLTSESEGEEPNRYVVIR